MAEKKKLLPKLYTVLWMGLLVALGVYFIGFAPREAAYSEAENRNLAGLPEISWENFFSGNFDDEIESYLLDHFPGRNTVISAVNRAESLLSFATHDEYLMIATDNDDPGTDDASQEDMEALLAELNATEPTVAPTQPPATETLPPQDIPAETTLPAEYPPIVPKPEGSIEDYPEVLGVFTDIGSGDVALRAYSRSSVAAATVVLNKYARTLPEDGKLLFTTGLSSYLINRFVNAEDQVNLYATWDEMVYALSDDNVFVFDSAETFREAIWRGEYVSFRTDNHWTPWGAYLMYCQMVTQAGKVPCDYYEDFEIGYEENFQGNYVRDKPSQYWNVEPDTMDLLMPKFPVELRKIKSGDEYVVMDFLNMNAIHNDRYNIYLSGAGGPWRYIECDNGETENCLVLTDSFGMTFIPFLTQNYKQIHYYDPRHYGYSVVGRTVAEMIEEYDIQDIYVVPSDFNAFSSFLISDANWQLNLD